MKPLIPSSKRGRNACRLGLRAIIEEDVDFIKCPPCYNLGGPQRLGISLAVQGSHQAVSVESYWTFLGKPGAKSFPWHSIIVS